VLCASPASKTAKDKNGPAVAKLQAAGVKALEVSHYYMHAKAIVADGEAFVGSQNFSTDGMKRNRELGDVFDQADVVSQLASMFETDYQNGAVAAAKKQAQQQ
jgi:phosphatidylserine/phosphatidylglycerophosphate/cardiolipin synthase-like enzyme